MTQKINDLNTVVKSCKRLQKQWEFEKGLNCTEANFFKIIAEYLLIEYKYKIEVEKAGKPIYHYFMYRLPEFEKEYFRWLYDPYNPVRFAVETFDSIEEIRLELENKTKK